MQKGVSQTAQMCILLSPHHGSFDDFEKIIEVPTMSEAKRGASLTAQANISLS